MYNQNKALMEQLQLYQAKKQQDLKRLNFQLNYFCKEIENRIRKDIKC